MTGTGTALSGAQRKALAELGAPDTSGIGLQWAKDHGLYRSAMDALVAKGLAEIIGTGATTAWIITDAGRLALSKGGPND